MDAEYKVCKIENVKTIQVQVPGSKSITNRALLLAALSNKKCILRGVLFSDDSRGFLDCLIHLGFQVEIREEIQEVTIWGEDSGWQWKDQCAKRRDGGEIFNGNAGICRWGL